QCADLTCRRQLRACGELIAGEFFDNFPDLSQLPGQPVGQAPCESCGECQCGEHQECGVNQGLASECAELVERHLDFRIPQQRVDRGGAAAVAQVGGGQANLATQPVGAIRHGGAQAVAHAGDSLPAGVGDADKYQPAFFYFTLE